MQFNITTLSYLGPTVFWFSPIFAATHCSLHLHCLFVWHSSPCSPGISSPNTPPPCLPALFHPLLHISFICVLLHLSFCLHDVFVSVSLHLMYLVVQVVHSSYGVCLLLADTDWSSFNVKLYKHCLLSAWGTFLAVSHFYNFSACFHVGLCCWGSLHFFNTVA